MDESQSQAVTVMMGYREYARHREARGLPGKTLGSVQRAIDSGRIPAAALNGKKINRDLADASWAVATDPAQQRRTPEPEPLLDGVLQEAPTMKALDWPEWPGWKPTDPPSSKTIAGVVVDGASFQAARARRELAEAALAEMELAEKQGTLVPASETAKVLTAAGRIFGKRCETLSAQLAPRLVGCTDVKELERILRFELRRLREGAANEIEKRFAGDRGVVRSVAG